MPLLTVEELAVSLPRGRTIAGLDLGTKTMGLAVSDLGFSLATPRTMIGRRKFTQDAEALAAALVRDVAGALVVGLPVNMDGSEGPRAQSTRAFMRNFTQLHDLPHIFWDERWSTVAAERTLVEMDVSRQKRRDRVDSAAAAFILQGALDRLRALGTGSTP